MAISDTNLIWLDMEMTGLTDKDFILEIATVVTDKDLNTIAEGPVLAIHQPDNVLNNMDDWNTSHHTKSGLIERSRKNGVSVQEAEQKTLEFLRRHVNPGKSPMCGNTIGQDRRFMWRFMTELEAFFHYRNLDVSTLKILAQLWHPNIALGFTKASKHEALSDIYDSIAELRYYRDMFDL